MISPAPPPHAVHPPLPLRTMYTSGSTLDVRNPQPAAEPPSDASIPTLLGGRYRLFAPIASGGMGHVYSANDEQLGIVVAVKVLQPERATAAMRARMVQEARAAAAIRHPNIVRVYAVDHVESTTYLVMELLRGATLEAHLQEQPDQRLPWRDAIRLLLPTMDAVQAIHDRGYVHRDIKPANLMVLAPDGRCEGAVVIDLGIARREPDMRTAHAPPTTEAGLVLGTPAYMPPEQANAQPLDVRADVYAMAVTLYRALVGRPPFMGDDRAGLLVHQLYTPPPPIDRVAPTARIPRAVADIVGRALAKDPDERPPTMRAFAEQLRRVVGPERTAPAWRHLGPLCVCLAGGVLLGAELAPRDPHAAAPPCAADPTIPATAAKPSTARDTTAAVVPASIAELSASRTPAASRVDPPAPAIVAPSTPPPARPTAVPDPRAALRRVQQQLAGLRLDHCVRGLAGAEVRVPVRISFTVDRPTIEILDRSAMVAARCVDDALAALVLPAAPAGAAVEHTFALHPTSHGT